MGDYTKLSLDKAKEIFKLYKDEEITELKGLSLGISNSNYKVTTAKGTYLLKVSNDKDALQLKEEMKILNYLKDQKYPYSLDPFQTKDKKTVYELDEFYGVLFPFIEGIPPGPSDITCYEIGKVLAKLHLVKVPGPSKGIRKYKQVGFDAESIKDYTQNPHGEEFFKQMYYDVFPAGLDQYISTQYAEGIIHGDLYYDNTLFHNEEVACVLDFEQAGVGAFIIDLGICISGTCLEKDRISDDLIKSFLEGYESVRKLPQIEKDSLKDSICVGLFSISLWRIKRFVEGNLNPMLSNSYKDLLYKAKMFVEGTSL